MSFFFPVSPLSQLFWHCDQIDRVHERPAGASLLSFLCDCAHQRNREDPGCAEGGGAGNSHPADQGSSKLWWKGCVLYKGVVLTCGAEECECLCTVEQLTWALQSSESVLIHYIVYWVSLLWRERLTAALVGKSEFVSLEERGEKIWESWRNSKGKRDYSLRSLKFFNYFRSLPYLKQHSTGASCWRVKNTAIWSDFAGRASAGTVESFSKLEWAALIQDNVLGFQCFAATLKVLSLVYPKSWSVSADSGVVSIKMEKSNACDTTRSLCCMAKTGHFNWD